MKLEITNETKFFPFNSHEAQRLWVPRIFARQELCLQLCRQENKQPHAATKTRKPSATATKRSATSSLKGASASCGSARPAAPCRVNGGASRSPEGGCQGAQQGNRVLYLGVRCKYGHNRAFDAASGDTIGVDYCLVSGDRPVLILVDLMADAKAGSSFRCHNALPSLRCTILDMNLQLECPRPWPQSFTRT